MYTDTQQSKKKKKLHGPILAPLWLLTDDN